MGGPSETGAASASSARALGIGSATVALVMIVKNEAEVLPRCLETIRPFISYYVICDTGSSDGTQTIAREALAGIEGRVFDLPFVSFGHNRSEALVAARGTADWLLCLDADCTVSIDPDFEPDPAVEAYTIDFGWVGFENRLPLLLRGDLPWKSVGAVHEATVLPGRMYVGHPTDAIRIAHHGENRNTPAKWKWHASLLEAELERDPTNARSAFYLAETYKRMGDLTNARRLYRQRAGMVGFVEETWFAQFQAALLEEDWPARQAALVAAWEARPSRLEPLHALISELNRRDMHATAYALSYAGATALHSSDVLFVDTTIRDWGLAFQRSIAAWYCGHRDESRALSLELLENPRLPLSVREAVQRNLALTPERAAA